jgi:hypothetical protein
LATPQKGKNLQKLSPRTASLTSPYCFHIETRRI